MKKLLILTLALSTLVGNVVFGKNISFNKSEAVSVEQEVYNQSKPSSGDTEINISKENNLNIDNNSGIIYVYIIDGTEVHVKSEDGKEPNIDISDKTSIELIGTLDTNKNENEETDIKTEMTENKKENEEEKNPKPSKQSKRKEYDSKKEDKKNSDKTSEYFLEPIKIVNNVPLEKKALLIVGSNSILLDNDKITYDVAPYISNDYVLVPLRAVSDIFDAQINWDQFTSTASIISDGNVALFKADSNFMKYNNIVKSIPKSAEITNNRMYVPLRAVIEALKAKVEWISDTKTIVITK